MLLTYRHQDCGVGCPYPGTLVNYELTPIDYTASIEPTIVCLFTRAPLQLIEVDGVEVEVLR